MNITHFKNRARSSIAAGATVAGLSLAFVAGSLALSQSTAVAATSNATAATVSSAASASPASSASTTTKPAASNSTTSTSAKPASTTTKPDASSSATSTNTKPATAASASSSTSAAKPTAKPAVATPAAKPAAAKPAAPVRAITPPLTLTQSMDHTLAAVPSAPISAAIDARITALEKANNYQDGYLYFVDPAYAPEISLDGNVDHAFTAYKPGTLGGPDGAGKSYTVSNASVGGAWFYATGANRGQLVQYNSNGEPESSPDEQGVTAYVLRAVPRDTQINYNVRLIFSKADFQKGETINHANLQLWSTSSSDGHASTKITLPAFDLSQSSLDPTMISKYPHALIMRQTPQLPLFDSATGRQIFYSMTNGLYSVGNMKDSAGNPIVQPWSIGVGASEDLDHYAVTGDMDRYVSNSVRLTYLRTNGQPDVSARPQTLDFTIHETPATLDTDVKPSTAQFTASDTSGDFPHILFYPSDLTFTDADGSYSYWASLVTPTAYATGADADSYVNHFAPLSPDDVPGRYNTFSLVPTAPDGYTVKSVKGDGWNGWDVTYVKNFVGTSVTLSYKDAQDKDITKTVTLEKDEPVGDALSKVELPAQQDGSKVYSWTDAKTGKTITPDTIVKEGMKLKANYGKAGDALTSTEVKLSYTDAKGNQVSTTVQVDDGSPILPVLPQAKPAAEGETGAWVDSKGNRVTDTTLATPGETYTYAYFATGAPLIADEAEPAKPMPAKPAMPGKKAEKKVLKKEAKLAPKQHEKQHEKKQAGTPDTADASMIAPVATAAAGLVSAAGAFLFRKKK